MAVYKGIIFDLDGTLLNTIDDIHDAMNFALIKNGLSEVSRNDMLTFIGNGVLILVERAIGHFGKNKENDYELYQSVINDYSVKYKECSTNKTQPFDHIIGVLKFLKKEGLKLAVLSNKAHSDVCDIVNRYFPNMFNVICGAKDGFEVKPNPTLALNILDEFCLKKEEVLFVGDSDVDIFTARNAGFDSVGVLYGYRTEKEICNSKPTYLIKNPRGLLKYFRKQIDGILLIDKPIGCTSQDVVTSVKHILNVEKVGHAGTLDPFASGLLVILLGAATKLSNYLLEENKEYIATIVIGKTTNTLDCDGDVTEIKCVDEELDVDSVLNSLIGKIELVPPMFSAIKINGKKMYDLARKGEIVDIGARKNEIYILERLSDIKYKDGLAYFDFLCSVSKGTYIRSLANKIGEKLGYPAYLKSLRRTKSGQMRIEDAISIEEMCGQSNVVSIIDALENKCVININETIYNRVKNGMKIYLNNVKEKLVFLAYNNDLVGIYEKVDDDNNNQYIARRVWK